MIVAREEFEKNIQYFMKRLEKEEVFVFEHGKLIATLSHPDRASHESSRSIEDRFERIMNC